jgi:hypothetical protein
MSESAVESKTPEAEKIRDYLRVIENKDLSLHPPALYALSKLNAAQFARALIKSIEMFPTDSEEPYYWMCPMASIASMALRCDDPKVWPALAKAARRAKPGLRMEILCRATWGEEADVARHRKELLAMLADFLDDSALSDSTTDRKIQMPMANYEYVKIEIRNGVTTGMGRILKVDVGPDTNRKPEEWAILRARVREAWKREQLKQSGEQPTRPG